MRQGCLHMPLTVTRFDRGNIVSKAQLTDEGYLKASAIVTRAGIFDYANADGSIRKELRHPDDVFNADSLESMKMRPVTNGHPPQKLVSAQNIRSLQVGHTGETVNVQKPYIATSVLITDPNTVEDILNHKKTELSLGYNVDLIEEAGVYEGKPYTHRQTNIRYNHLAVVDRARAGPEARIHLDENDAEEMQSPHNDYQSFEQKEIVMTDKEMKLTTINIDSLSYQCAPEVANAYSKLSAKAEDYKQKYSSSKTEIERLKAERDSFSQKLDEAKNIDIESMIHDGVKKRVALIQDVKMIMAKKSDDYKFDSMTDREMKAKVVKEKCPSVDIENVSDIYLDGRFDALKEDAQAELKKESPNFGKQRAAVVTAHDSKCEPEDQNKADEARQRMMSRMYDRKDRNMYAPGNTASDGRKDTYGRNQSKSYDQMFCNK